MSEHSDPFSSPWAALSDAVTRLMEDFPETYWQALDRERAYPADFVARLTAEGYLAALIPEGYGGSGLPLDAAGEILRAIHAAGGNAAAAHAQMYVMGTVLRHGSEAQKTEYLPRIASGELRLQAFGVTEPASGTDTTKLKTRAIRDGDGYVVNGQKIWTSRAEHSDMMLLLARTTPLEEVARKTEGLSVFLVDLRETPGVTIRPIETMINHATTEVFFDNMRIPTSSLVGEEGKGLRYILSGMNAERVLIAYECLGDAEYFLRRACEYAGTREVFGKPIGANQAIAFPLARAHAQTEAARLMTMKAARWFEEAERSGEAANSAKMLAAEASWAAGEAAMTTFGGYAFATEMGIERKWRETRLYQTAPISTNMILAYLAEHVLGLPRTY